MNPYKLKEVYKYLTRAKKIQPDLPDVFPASKAPIPAKTQNVETIEAINRFNRDNPRTEKAGGGMLVQPSVDGSRPGYANPKGNPELGTKYTGEQFKGTIRPENQKRLNKVIELITESNGSYKKNLTAKEILQKAGFKDGYQSIGTTQAIRPAIMKEMKKLLTNQQKIDNYVNNVMLSKDALVKDFKNPQQHLAKKFGVSRGTMRNWAKNSEVYKDNKALFNGLSKELSFNKYKFEGEGVPRLMSDYSLITQKKLPSSQMAYGADSPTKFIMDSAFRSYMQNKAAGKKPKIFFVGNPELMSPSEWKFIKGDKLYSTDASITELEFNGKTYKNNYLNRVDAKTLYANDFGNVYKKYDDLDKYMNTFVPDPNNPKKQILLDTLLRRKAFEESKTIKNPKGKKNFLERRFVELDHRDLLNDPFGNNNPNNLRLLDRQTNVKAGLFKRLNKYKNNPKLLNKTLTDIGYFNMDKDTDAFIKRMTKRVIPTSSNIGTFTKPVSKTAMELSSFPANIPAMYKKLGSVGRKVVGFGTGALSEKLFFDLDKNNMISKGMSEKEASAQAMENLTFGLYENKAYMNSLKEIAESMGIDSSTFDSAYNLNILSKQYDQNTKNVQDQVDSALQNDDQKTADDLIKNYKVYQNRTKKEYERLENDISGRISGGSPQIMSDAKNFLTDEQFQKPFYDMQDAAIEKLKKEKLKAFDTQKLQSDTAAGNIGNTLLSNVFNTQSLPKAGKFVFDLANPFSPLPKYKDYLSDAEKENQMLRSLEPSDLNLVNLARGFTKDNIRSANIESPILASDIENIKYENPGVFFAGGGIAKVAGVDKGPPPESGPNPQGLLSLMKRARNY